MQQTVHRSSFVQIMRGYALLSVLACALAFTGLALTGTPAEAGGSPLANAEADKTVNANASVTLSGTVTCSGCIASVKGFWTQTGGTAVSLSGATSPATAVATPGTGYNQAANATASFIAPPSAGTLTFKLTACYASLPDADCLASFYTDSVTITVGAHTPEQAIVTLIGDVEDLVTEGTLTGGQGSALTSKLEAAEAKLAEGTTQPAINKLQAFINQVQAFINGHLLTTAEGQPLLDAAMAIIAQLDA